MNTMRWSVATWVGISCLAIELSGCTDRTSGNQKGSVVACIDIEVVDLRKSPPVCLEKKTLELPLDHSTTSPDFICNKIDGPERLYKITCYLTAISDIKSSFFPCNWPYEIVRDAKSAFHLLKSGMAIRHLAAPDEDAALDDALAILKTDLTHRAAEYRKALLAARIKTESDEWQYLPLVSLSQPCPISNLHFFGTRKSIIPQENTAKYYLVDFDNGHTWKPKIYLLDDQDAMKSVYRWLVRNGEALEKKSNVSNLPQIFPWHNELLQYGQNEDAVSYVADYAEPEEYRKLVAIFRDCGRLVETVPGRKPPSPQGHDGQFPIEWIEENNKGPQH